MPPCTPTDYFLLNCGSPSNTTSSDGRNWDGDVHSKFSPSNMADISSASTAAKQDPSVPYLTARIFNSQFTYTFPVSAGQKCARLYFYPATYFGLDKTKSFFSVTAGDYTLLSKFSAFLTVANPKQASLIKEFIVNNSFNKLNAWEGLEEKEMLEGEMVGVLPKGLAKVGEGRGEGIGAELMSGEGVVCNGVRGGNEVGEGVEGDCEVEGTVALL
ncbi:hypothetical protein F0562_005159 [Nyssa sinensis]|uniref:Malectin domain-containing protein n=1 Tax=Nyssa sinensis TaxID=561372 RepID=A0A5J5AIM2_9ASTE|nr:hypothetical protein F0562_005159 [Nyssa sinensis]